MTPESLDKRDMLRKLLQEVVAMVSRTALCWALMLAFLTFDLPAQKKAASDPSTQPSANDAKKSSKPAKAKPVRNKTIKPTTSDNNGVARSVSPKKQFMIDTGFPKGRLGYVVDYIVPLKCGGPDIPSNMEWLTVEEAKAKHRADR